MTRPARLLTVHGRRDSVTMLFATGDAEIPVTVGIQAATAHALHHLSALHAHPSGCRGAPSSQVHVDLLVRVVRTLGGQPACVVVRPGTTPAFWLRIADAAGLRELDLDVLDATCLLLSRRVPVELIWTSDSDWDHALSELLASHGQEGEDHPT